MIRRGIRTIFSEWVIELLFSKSDLALWVCDV